MSEFSSRTSMKISDDSGIFDRLRSYVTERGLPIESESEAHIKVKVFRNTIDFELANSKVDIVVKARNQGILVMLREMVIDLITKCDASTAADITWLGETVTVGLPPGFRQLSVLRKREVFPGMMRVTFSAEGLESFRDEGLHVSLLFQTDASRKPVWPQVRKNASVSWPQGRNALAVRIYTIRNVRVEDNEIDVDFVLHAHGLASDWVRGAQQDDVIGMIGPGGGFLPPADRPLLMGGDATALPAIARILENLDKSAQGHAVIAAPKSAFGTGYFPETSLKIVRLSADASMDTFLAAYRECWGHDSGSYGWFGGEFETANAIRRLFKDDLSLAKNYRFSVPYWKYGRTRH